MARKKNFENLSAQELYELAKQREQEEMDAQREEVKAQIQALRDERREVVARQRRELAALDRRIRELGGRGPATGKRGRSRSNLSESVLRLIAESGEISTKELQARLEAEGAVPKNLGQTLAYLKRTGRVRTPRRAVYAVAK